MKLKCSSVGVPTMQVTSLPIAAQLQIGPWEMPYSNNSHNLCISTIE